MDDGQTVFVNPAFHHHQHSYPPFDIDMMKRSNDAAGQEPWNKKARTSPNGASYPIPQQQQVRDDYAYSNGIQPLSAGPFANQQPQQQQTQQLYATTNQLNGPNSASVFAAAQHQAQQQQQVQQAQQAQQQNNAGNGYNFAQYGLGMNMANLAQMGMLGGFPYSPQLGSFQQSFNQPQLGMQGMQAQGYSPAALNAAMMGGGVGAAVGPSTGRTVYVGSLPATASVDELLNLVHFGPIESVRVLPEKSCVFISFLDAQTAASFHADATIKKLSLHNQELKIGWGKPSPVPSQVMLSIQQSNASRNVYLGGLDEGTTEEQLRDDLSRFGLIDQVKIVRDKNIAFVHFLSISTATKVVATLPTEPAWAGKRVNYGKDRCAYIPKSQQAAAQAAQAAAAQTLVAQQQALSPLNIPHTTQPGLPSPFSPYPPFSPDALATMVGANVTPNHNRTVYLGNIHPETTPEDLCNAIRGGVLQSIRFMQDKHIAFVTFIDPAAAFTFFQVASFQGLTINNRRLKVGWGKNNGPLSPQLALAVHGGATRNVYVGNIEDFDVFTDEKLKTDFGEYGEIELVNFLREKNCAFVNFMNIQSAIRAIENVKAKPDYGQLRIAHGKDRCANAPRAGPQGSSAIRRTASGGNGGSSSTRHDGGSDGTDGLLLSDGSMHIKQEMDDGLLHAETSMIVDAPTA